MVTLSDHLTATLNVQVFVADRRRSLDQVVRDREGLLKSDRDPGERRVHLVEGSAKASPEDHAVHDLVIPRREGGDLRQGRPVPGRDFRARERRLGGRR